ncbi:MAG: hypothetical protein K2X95_12085 [Flavobacteriaceae bacterium]|nr:hypothetical protein [Flavobacteriaceae bacterium]
MLKSCYFYRHFSKYIHKKAKRVSTSVSRSSLLSTSFFNIDGKTVTIVMNQTNKSVTYDLIVAS